MLILFNGFSNMQLLLPIVMTEKREGGADKAVNRNEISNNP
jgi:hypothetical protein